MAGVTMPMMTRQGTKPELERRGEAVEEGKKRGGGGGCLKGGVQGGVCVCGSPSRTCSFKTLYLVLLSLRQGLHSSLKGISLPLNLLTALQQLMQVFSVTGLGPPGLFLHFT